MEVKMIDQLLSVYQEIDYGAISDIKTIFGFTKCIR